MTGLDATHRPGIGAVSAGGPRSRLWRLRLATSALLLALIGELVYAVLASPRFAMREVLVRGDPEIAREAASRISLPPNTNMFRAPLEAVKRQAEGVAAVREARLARSFPNRLVVAVERREPAAVIRHEDRAILVDPEGIPFILPQEWGWGLPELIGPHIASGDVRGEKAELEIALLLGVMRALGNDPGLRVSRLRLGRDGQVEIVLESGTRVNLGTEDRLTAKVKLLAAALEQIGRERIARIDLAEPAAAFWEPVDGLQSAAVR